MSKVLEGMVRHFSPSKKKPFRCARAPQRARARARSVAPMDAREMAPDEAIRSRQGSPGREDDEGMGDDPRVDPDDRRYDSTHEAEYDPEDDRNVDDVDVDEAYDDDGYSKEEPDEEEDEPGGGFLGLMSYLWMLVALALFAYLIHKVQQQASVIKALQRRAASMEAPGAGTHETLRPGRGVVGTSRRNQPRCSWM